MKRKRQFVIAIAAGLLAGGVAQGSEWSGSAAFEYRGFTQSAANGQADNDYSVSLQPEFVHPIGDSKDSIRFIGFARADKEDENRTHADIRELSWIKVGEDYEWRVGIRKVFWGVTESQHLVDVINQTDLVENIDNEEKLGQPMINLALIRDWGTVDFFVLPYFRERTFPAAEGRLRTPFPVDTDRALFESDRKQNHIDYAVRYAKSWSGIDLGLAYFKGTSRDPLFLFDGFSLIPYYQQMEQFSLDVAATTGAWLWKLEAIDRNNSLSADFIAATAGFEYTLSGVFGSGADLGLLAEYMYDDRDNLAPTPLQNDVLLGVRLALNDEQSSDLLVGVVQDLDSDARFFNVEASRRLGANYRLSLEARSFVDIPSPDPLYSFQRDDYVQLELTRYF
jgi:hypothetical protein